MKFWLAINGNLDLSLTPQKEFWWCLPFSASESDKVLVYRPRAVSRKYCGVYATASIITPPSKRCEKNSYCNAYGKSKDPFYGYAELLINDKFEKFLTAERMKLDPFMSSSDVIKKNFQGTTFELSENVFRRMLSLIQN